MSSFSAVFPLDTSTEAGVASVRQAYLNASAMAIFALVGYTLYHNLIIFSSFFNPLLWAALVGFVLHFVKLRAVRSVRTYVDSAELSASVHSLPALLYLAALPLVHLAHRVDALSTAIFDWIWAMIEWAWALSWAHCSLAVAVASLALACSVEPSTYWLLHAAACNLALDAHRTLLWLADWSWAYILLSWLALLLFRFRIRALVKLQAGPGRGEEQSDTGSVQPHTRWTRSLLNSLDWAVCAVTFTIFPAAPLYASWGSLWSTLSSGLCCGLVYLGYLHNREDEPATACGTPIEEGEAGANGTPLDVADLRTPAQMRKAPETIDVQVMSRASSLASAYRRTVEQGHGSRRGGRRRRRRRAKSSSKVHQSMWFALLYVLCAAVLITRFPLFRILAGVGGVIVGGLVVAKVVTRILAGPTASWSSTVAYASSTRVASAAGRAWADALWLLRRVSPAPVVEFVRLMWDGVVYADRAIVAQLRDKANVLVTLMLIVAFFVTTMGGGTFLTFQLQAESMVMFTKSQQVWRAATHAPLVERVWFASVGARDAVAMDAAFASAYDGARSAALSWVQSRLEEAFGTNVNITYIESQVTAYWLSAGGNGNGTASSGSVSEPPGVANGGRSPGSGAGPVPSEAPLAWMASIVRQASELRVLQWVRRLKLAQVRETVGAYLSSISQAATSTFSFVSFVFWLSFAVLKGTIDMAVSLVIFFSALGYFLVSDTFRPLDILTSFLPTAQLQAKLRKDVEDTLNQVFLASILLAWYHFLLVWATFEFVGADLVYIPALLSASMAVIPKFPSFLFVVPFAVEMWLVQDKPYAALFGMFLPHLLAWWFVDTAIQASIKRSHPYLTGLAMVGGLSQFGLQGAIFGPLLVSMLMIATSFLTSEAAASDEFMASFTGAGSSPTPLPPLAFPTPASAPASGPVALRKRAAHQRAAAADSPLDVVAARRGLDVDELAAEGDAVEK
ncbi:uncharacterized protein AMSG_06992 [Thecamonas trahens ATCC 50062]|uniref:Transmembrane protein n=1 Tax=Thecamonas trahens ATCC 50062 TaxID=461836 RepID=A0A0L0DFS4_THETB|nr:hypothetical protein AMSG_06992 [Thecamonas trahens ATCC 50062]KNC51016.1 hypothetical protein AMSG_06992 [Thecamonas trahens ATCC 50062]|eukprot:XP_013756483.1 hypothetical protein AMSG_06992 [Thecamonas trahens ATCC 50062]